MTHSEHVIFALERVKARVKTNDTVTGLVWLLAAVSAGLLVLMAADQIAPLEQATRLVLVAALGVLSLAALALVLFWPTLKRVNNLFAARLIERQAESQFRNSLVSFVELQGDPRVAADIRAAVAAKADHDLRTIDLDLVVDRRPLVRAVVALGLAVLVTIIFAALTPKSFAVSVARAVGFDVAAPTATRIIDVTPLDGQTVLTGEDVTVTASIGGAVPHHVELLASRDGRYWDTLPMRPAGPQRWELLVGDLRGDLKFRVRAGDARSAERRVKVLPLPAVTAVRTRLTYPAYTHLGVEPRDTGNVEALIGTVVEVVARTNVPLRDAPQLVFGDGTRVVPMTLAAAGGTEARGSFAVDRDDSYTIRFYDPASDRTNAAPLKYQIKALTDQPPAVELSGVAGVVKVAANGTVTFNVRARDDYGLDRLVFVWRRETPGSAPGPEQTIPVSAAPADQAILAMPAKAPVRVADLGLAAGDEATCRFVAYDRRPAGPQEGRSAEIRLVVTPPDANGGGAGDSTTADAGHGSGPPNANGSGHAPAPEAALPQPGQLTAQQQRDLESMRESLAKLEQALAKPNPGQPAPGSSGETPPKQPQPGETPPKPNDNHNRPGPGEPPASTGTGSTGMAANGGGPASENGPNSTNRPPDAQLGPRETNFTESGHGLPPAARDARLLQTVGPQIRQLDEQLRRGTVDERLLQDLGWNRSQLQTFVSEFKERFGAFAAPPNAGTGTAVAPAPRATDVTVGSDGPGAVGAGVVAAERGPNDLGSAAIETQTRRVSPRFAKLVEEYLKNVNEAETTGGR